ncbi:MAG: rRNA maturation RNAse YbeY, partial [Desulfovibrio sp.]|nr:rRNA maturation RNAse YbeY [Desulfovibrio sp.]
YGGDKHARLSLGCLALSVDTLLRECFLYGQNTDEHCIRLLAHGLSHLMGMDHGPEMDSLADRLAQSAHAALLSR